MDFLSLMAGKDLPIIETRFGEILGEETFLKAAVERFDRRKNEYGEEMKRIEDRFFEPVEKVIWEFEKKIGEEIEDIRNSLYV
jgi:hypothetical protein